MRIPYIVAPRGMLVPELIKRRRRLLKSVWLRIMEDGNFRDAAAFHFTSQLEAEQCVRLGFPIKRWIVIANGIDPDTFDVDSEPRPSDRVAQAMNRGPYLLYIGRINWKKGLDRLIASLPMVPHLRLVVAGNDEERYQHRLKEIIKQEDLGNRVKFVGPVYGDDKSALLRKAVALALVSHSENFGNVVLEAMAVGCPVIVSPQVGLAGVVERVRSGVVVEPEPNVLARAIREVWSDQGLRKAMGERGRAVVEAEYHWSTVAEKMERAYREILNGVTDVP
jgi:glycosyltransferase involved in cell wall biosynthesis